MRDTLLEREINGLTFIVKICGNKPADFPGLFEFIATHRAEQLRIFGELKIDLRAGILVGQKHPSPDFLELREARAILADAPPESMVVVTHLDTVSELIDLTGKTEGAAVQIHKKLPIPEDVETLKHFYPERKLWHVIHAPSLEGDPTTQAAEQRHLVVAARDLVMAGAEAIVLDTYDVKSGRVGGTGISIGRKYARRFRDAFKAEAHSGQLVLAGGLKPYSVADTIRAVWPDGIDANTGLNFSLDDRLKDPAKIELYFEEALEGAHGPEAANLWALCA